MSTTIIILVVITGLALLCNVLNWGILLSMRTSAKIWAPSHLYEQIYGPNSVHRSWLQDLIFKWFK